MQLKRVKKARKEGSRTSVSSARVASSCDTSSHAHSVNDFITHHSTIIPLFGAFPIAWVLAM